MGLTPLPGGVPDGDDTAGALLALRNVQLPGAKVTEAARLGVTWLLNLQNRDGGIPTFCRGWGKLPFDRSSADLTAHALRAWYRLGSRVDAGIKPANRVCEGASRPFPETNAGSGWKLVSVVVRRSVRAGQINRVYGTSRVLLALAEMGLAADCARRAASWLARVQKPVGGWRGGAGPGPSSTEETALALEALCALVERCPELQSELAAPIRQGLEHLLNRIAEGAWTEPAPIGFYFAKLWVPRKIVSGDIYGGSAGTGDENWRCAWIN